MRGGLACGEKVAKVVSQIRCPNCGRFCKKPRGRYYRGEVVVVTCSKCGVIARIVVPNNAVWDI